MERYEVQYNGHTYARNALNLEELMEFGLRIMPRLAGFASVTGVVYANKFEAGDNLYSFYQTVKDVFDKDDWKWLVKLMLQSPESCLSIDGIDCSDEEVNEHFAGDFLSVYCVTLGFAWQNVGEFKGLKEKLNGLFGDIAESLEVLIKNQTEMIRQGLKTKSEKSRK